jgi:type I restriction enzyme S subunit
MAQYLMKKWANVVKIISGKNQKKVANKKGKYAIYGSGGIIGKADDFLCEAGTTIVGRKGTINKPIFVNEQFWNVDTAFGIYPSNQLVPKFLYYFCCLYDFTELDKSTTIPSLAKRDLLNIEMPVPPLEEQERIVNRIEELFSELDKAVETLRTTKEQLAVYRQVVLKEAFESMENSEEFSLESLCEYIVDCPHSTPKWVAQGKLCLRTTNFKRGYLDLSEKNYVSNETFRERISRLKPQSGDVLFSREGAILGIACIIPKEVELCMGQRMMLLRVGEKLYNRYLMHYLNSARARQLVIENTGGSASPHINVGDIRKFNIPIVEMKQQIKIASEIDSRMSVCDSIEQTVDTSLQQAEALRQSILKQAFEGEL